jgi:(2R)-ethylmalonyl-CoA mutase
MSVGKAGEGRDKPWLMRTYSGHTSAQASNELFRANLAKGQTGLSIAFDLPTQTGFDSDHPLARGEVGKVGVPVGHLGDMEALFEAIPLAKMNTSMTINATAAWLLALYVALAEKKGVARRDLSGTVQNDIIKEYLSRGTYIFPPEPSLRLITDVIAFTAKEVPKWNPINVCSYHLQEAGAEPVEELAFALATAIAVLDRVRDSGQVSGGDFPAVVGRVSFFVNAGVKLITELSKLRAFAALWDAITHARYGVEDAKYRRFRYGVQVNSLGLTEQQPENNVYRIMIEMLAVLLSKDARARAVQLPAWNEALGLPRPWDQQWSLRCQQIAAFETDILDYDDIFEGSQVIAAKVAELKDRVLDELGHIEAMGGAVAAVESGYMKERLVRSNARRVAAIESGAQTLVGVNAFTESAPSPLLAEGVSSFLKPDPRAEERQIAALRSWRAARDSKAAEAALEDLKGAAQEGRNVMEPSIACAHVGVTTGEWAGALREVFGEYRAPTGIAAASGGVARGGAARGDAMDARLDERYAEARAKVARLAKRLGRPPKLLIGKPGLDGHSSGAEQIALAARDLGLEVIYEGIRLAPAEIVKAAQEEDVHLIGLSVLSGSHLAVIADVMAGLRDVGLDDLPVVLGGIIPDEDASALKEMGIARIYTPKDFEIAAIMEDIVGIIAEGAEESAA